jgi:hypothetical protein
MNKEEYIKELNKLSEANSKLTKKKSELRDLFIESNKPCNIDDNIKVVTSGGRILRGQAKAFSVNQHKEVFVSAIKPHESTIIYLSVAHKSIELL